MTDQVTKLNITKNLVEKISELLDAEVTTHTCLITRVRKEKFLLFTKRKMTAVIYLEVKNGNEWYTFEVTKYRVLVYKLGRHFTQRGFEAEFGEDVEYPQINIGFRHTET